MASIAYHSPLPPEKEAPGFGRNSKGDSPIGGHWSPPVACCCSSTATVSHRMVVCFGRPCVNAFGLSFFLPVPRIQEIDLFSLDLPSVPCISKVKGRAAMDDDADGSIHRSSCSCLTHAVTHYIYPDRSLDGEYRFLAVW